MENVIANEDVMETVEGMVVKTGSGDYVRIIAIGAIVIIACGATYKYVVKPIIAKIKLKKNGKKPNLRVVDGGDYDEESNEDQE